MYIDFRNSLISYTILIMYHISLSKGLEIDSNWNETAKNKSSISWADLQIHSYQRPRKVRDCHWSDTLSANITFLVLFYCFTCLIFLRFDLFDTNFSRCTFISTHERLSQKLDITIEVSMVHATSIHSNFIWNYTNQIFKGLWVWNNLYLLVCL